MIVIPAAALIDRASDLLKDINLLYGLASGVLLKYSFDHSHKWDKFQRGEVLAAAGAALGAAILAFVLVALMGPIAWDAMRGDTIDGTLVIFVLTFAVMVGLALVSLWALWRAGWDLWHFRTDLFKH